MGTIHVGIAGWSYPDWAGIVYPATRPRGFSELAYLSRYVDAMEINSTFYRPAAPASADKWLRHVEDRPDFLFTAKLWQRFTHQREQAWSDRDVRQVADGMEPLREAGRLGALLMQFPWSFKASDAERDWLARLSDAFRPFPCVVEVRHSSWDNEDSRDFLKRQGLNFCNIDQPQIGASIGPTNVATGPVAYYRFHGRNAKAWFDPEAGRDNRYNYLYQPAELAPWVDDIRQMVDRAQRLFVMTNNHYQGQEVVNALQLKAALEDRRVPAPAPLVERFPVLREIAEPMVGQGRLGF